MAGKEYAFYLDGKKIAILQKYTSTLATNGTYIAQDYWGTPDTAVTNAIFFKFNVKINAPTDDTTDIGVSDILELGIVEYVKYRLFEDSGEYDKAQYHYKQFKKFVGENQANYRGSPLIVAPAKMTSLR